jgi:hypothetical protein
LFKKFKSWLLCLAIQVFFSNGFSLNQQDFKLTVGDCNLGYFLKWALFKFENFLNCDSWVLNFRPVPQLGAIQSLLPFHSAVSSARLTSCLSIDSRSSRSLSQGMLCSANPGVWYSPNVLVLVFVSNFFTLQLVHVSILNRFAWFCLFILSYFHFF